MKFGKRLRRDAYQPWLESYICYKALKGCIKLCASSATVLISPDRSVVAKTSFSEGVEFFVQLHNELLKVNAFFTDKEIQLGGILTNLEGCAELYNDDGTLSKYVVLCEDIDRLRKYVVLNYLAVRKILKKYDKKTKQPTVTPMILFLHNQPFYNSLTLANIITKAQCLGVQIKQARGEAAQFPKEDFLCPVCLDVLNNPVVLSCAHRFCWACLAGASMFTSHNSSCPVCRKQQSLDPRNYTVDSLLMSFIRDKVSPLTVDISPMVENELPPKVDDISLPMQSGEVSNNTGGFFYFFQQEHKVPTSITLLLVQSKVSGPTQALKFVKHVNVVHPNTDFCILSTPQFGDVSMPEDLGKFPRVTTMLKHTIETHKVPYVSFAEETPLGTLLVLSFRSQKSTGKHQMPLLEDKLKGARSVFIVTSHCSFDQMDEVVYPVLLRHKRVVLRHLFLLSSHKEHTGTWRGIPFSALKPADATLPQDNVAYTEFDIQEDMVMVKPTSVAVVVQPELPKNEIIIATTIPTEPTTFEDANFKFVCVAYILFFVCILIYAASNKFL